MLFWEPYNSSGLYWFRRGFWSFGSHPRLWDRVKNLEIKFKRRRKFSVRCLRAAVVVWTSRSSGFGIKSGGALFPQSFERKKDFMKLLRAAACHPAVVWGNVKRMTVMGDAWMDRLSDAGSIPARSTKKIARNPVKSRVRRFFCLIHFDYFWLPGNHYTKKHEKGWACTYDTKEYRWNYFYVNL